MRFSTASNKLFSNTSMAIHTLERYIRYIIQVISDIVYILWGFILSIILSVLVIFPTWAVCKIKSKIVQRRWETKGYEMFSGHDAVMGLFPHIIINFAMILPEMPDLLEFHREMRVRLGDVLDENGRTIMPKFVQTMEEHDGYMFWKDVPRDKQDSHFHIFIHRGEAPASEAQLQVVISDLYCQPIPDGNPAWQIILIPLKGDLKALGMGCCTFFRVHHSIADGISLIRILMQHLIDTPKMFTHATELARAKMQETIPTKILRRVVSFPRLFEVWSKQFKHHPNNIFHGPDLIGESICSWMTFDLDYIKAVKNATNTTVNDVLMSCLGGALRNYCIWKDAPIPDDLKAFIPIALHLPECAADTNNAFSFVNLTIRTDIEDAKERLRETKLALDRLKRSPEAIVNYISLQSIMPCFPKKVLNPFLNAFNSGSIFTTNVCGPDEAFDFLGQKVINMFPLCHHHQKIGTAFGFFGYNGKLTLSYCVDKALCSNRNEVEHLLKLFQLELQVLGDQVLPKNNNIYLKCSGVA